MNRCDARPTTPLALSARPAAGPSSAERVQTLLATLASWRRRSLSRRELASLDDHLLHDIGVSRGQARFESDKPFWKR